MQAGALGDEEVLGSIPGARFLVPLRSHADLWP